MRHLLLLFLLLAGCSKLEVEHLATVGDSNITTETFRYWWDRETPPADSPESRTALLDKIVRRTALAEIARDAGLQNDPDVAAAIDSILIAKLQERDLQPALAAIEITEAEARAAYDPEKFTTPEKHHVALLWFDTRGQAPLEARYTARLENVRDQALADPSVFAQLASTNSEHAPSRHRNGDLGWLTPDQNDPVLRIAAGLATSLEPGQLSPVTTRPEGTFLVRLIDHQPGGTKPFDTVRDQIVARLTKEKRAAAHADFDRSTWQSVPVTRNPSALSNLTDLPTQQITSR